MRKNGFIVQCPVCGRGRYVTPGVLKQGKGKYCSRSCSSKVAVYSMLSARGDSWREHVKRSIIERFKDETKHPRWKGDKAGYYAVHDWITKHYGQPKYCDNCGLNDPKRMYHWANISLKYLRDRTDFKRLCVSCHRKYDYGRTNKKLENTPINEGQIRA